MTRITRKCPKHAQTDRRRADDRGAVPPADLRPRPDGRVVEAAADHGPGRRRLLLGRPRQALPRRPLRHLRRLGRPQQSPRHRGDPQAARHAALLAADARHQPGRRAAGEPAGRAGPRRPGRGQVPVRRLGGDRGRHQAGPAVPPAHRQPRQVQDHQPLPVLARLDAGLAVGVGPEGRARRSTSRWPPASSTSSRRPATAARSARPTRRAASPAPRSSTT